MSTIWAAKNSKKKPSNSTDGNRFGSKCYFLTRFLSRMMTLEEDRYDLTERHDLGKDELKRLRTRVNDLMGKNKTTKVNIRK